jgi:putative hydrolase of the HAD superfamily
MRVLDKYSVLLLDMNGTFMFGHDRFAETEDFHKTYSSLGGKRLASEQVAHSIRACFEGLNQDSTNPEFYDHFPTLAEGFMRHSNPPKSELRLLMKVFALHERGTVSDSCASLLRRLAKTHRLALISNIWSPKQPWLDEFERAGIAEVFRHKVFSSDFRSIKPSPVLFREALRGLGAHPDECLCIGDSLRCDMEGANKAGIATTWITSETKRPQSVNYLLSRIEEIEVLEL